MITSYLRDITRLFIQPLRYLYLKKMCRYNVHYTTMVSFSAFLDKTKPNYIYIGKNTIVTRGAIILSHDYTSASWQKTFVGENCFLGVNCIIMPGIHIGNEVVIGAGSVVTNDIDSNSVAVGNPARIIKKVRTGPYGRIICDMTPREEKSTNDAYSLD